jgi:hypothetical protein
MSTEAKTPVLSDNHLKKPDAPLEAVKGLKTRATPPRFTKVFLKTGSQERGPALKGKQSPFVLLVSSDGHEFFMKREDAQMSSTIKALLDIPGYREDEVVTLPLEMVDSAILERCFMYMRYKRHYLGTLLVNTPKFHVDLPLTIGVFIAADFLDI